MTKAYQPTAEQVRQFPRFVALVVAGSTDKKAIGKAIALDMLEGTLKAYRAARLAGGREFRNNRNLIHCTAPFHREGFRQAVAG